MKAVAAVIFLLHASVVLQAWAKTSTGTCDPARSAIISNTGYDAGYVDSYRGWYDVQGCGTCLDYCRWVGNCQSGGDPMGTLVRICENSESWWSCDLVGRPSQNTPIGYFRSFSFPKCSEKADVPPLSHFPQESRSHIESTIFQEIAALRQEKADQFDLVAIGKLLNDTTANKKDLDEKVDVASFDEEIMKFYCMLFSLAGVFAFYVLTSVLKRRCPILAGKTFGKQSAALGEPLLMVARNQDTPMLTAKVSKLEEHMAYLSKEVARLKMPPVPSEVIDGDESSEGVGSWLDVGQDCFTKSCHCVVEGVGIKRMFDLESGQLVKAGINGLAQVVEAPQVLPAAKRMLATVKTQQAEVTVAISHRFPMPDGTEKLASELFAKQDKVFVGDRWDLVQRVKTYEQCVEVVCIRFKPDVPVETFTLPSFGVWTFGAAHEEDLQTDDDFA